MREPLDFRLLKKAAGREEEDTTAFFAHFNDSWEKTADHLAPLIPRWLKTLQYGRILSRNDVKIVHQYEDLTEAQRFVAGQIQHNLRISLPADRAASVSAAYCKVTVNGIVSFGVMVNITLVNTPEAKPYCQTFEGFLNFQNRGTWDIVGVPDANDRTINDPAWLIPSNRTRQTGHPEFPIAMRLDMYGQYCVENGWTAYRVLGQQLLLTVELVIKKGQ